MTKLLVAALLSAGLASTATLPTPSPAQSRNEVIAAERAALDRWSKGDPEGFLSTYADEITYFDPMQDKRVDGVATMRALYAQFAGKFSIDRYEILNPKVQQSGDIAVLSYNLQNYMMKDGKEVPASKWNSTSVFRRIGGRWRTIHSHWSFTKPELKDAPPSP